ncbi:NAD-dependent epimerase/dehydratase family protein [Sandaracinobacter sp. RS1-74]|uniref:NAD-dependent epimerase/dehydratase family protein n=1 Tax=Sandaracinobacteroides sayramensis TaxID=2913411 RepID=UPI001EDB377F|nr:NAD-dependent epimerase/dehydratase family protein [Sandaracinobacteroides sayramensis]MCG2841758.1 NAD-dependent epimerase/dehydratase family protein [Sandaracinobacteroides sayramensis]
MATLVTGVAGFIGSAVAQALARPGEPVIGIDCLVPYYRLDLKEARLARLERPGFFLARTDFADMAALDEAVAAAEGRLGPVTRIVHLGAQPGVRWSIEHPHDYARSNLVGHLNLLELARRLQVPMVYASSSSVYGGNDKLPFAVEDRVDRPISLYAATKKADELLSESYAHLYRIPLTGLRFFTVYGPWGRPDMAVWQFTESCLQGRMVRIFNQGRMRRDFTYVDDIVAGVLACLQRPPEDDGLEKPGGSLSPHSIYNIGNNRSEALMHLVELVEQACGRPLLREYAPMQPGDVKDTFADISAIAQDHGFAPRTRLDEGIPRFVDWFRSWARP